MKIIDVAIVGAGFGGLCAAIRLRESGVDNVAILERSGEVGGTWRDNVYPGCACDVPSHMYSFSFEPNTRWTRPYPQQPEIQDYILRLTDTYQLRPLIRWPLLVLICARPSRTYTSAAHRPRAGKTGRVNRGLLATWRRCARRGKPWGAPGPQP